MDDLGATLQRIATALERMADAAEAESAAARMLTEAMRPEIVRAPRDGESDGARLQRAVDVRARHG